MLRTCLLLSAALLAAPALAEDIYRWTDANGEVHYTNDPSTVPPKAKASKVTNDNVMQEHRDSVRTVAPAPSYSQDSADEARWRGQFRTARERIAKLEAGIQADKATLADPAAHGINLNINYSNRGTVTPSPELEKVKAHLAQSEKELEQARRELEDLDRQASREAVPREWRK